MKASKQIDEHRRRNEVQRSQRPQTSESKTYISVEMITPTRAYCKAREGDGKGDTLQTDGFCCATCVTDRQHDMELAPFKTLVIGEAACGW